MNKYILDILKESTYDASISTIVRIKKCQVERAVERGWASVQALATMSQALQEWSQHPDGFFAQAWCEANAQKNDLRYKFIRS